MCFTIYNTIHFPLRLNNTKFIINAKGKRDECKNGDGIGHRYIICRRENCLTGPPPRQLDGQKITRSPKP